MGAKHCCLSPHITPALPTTHLQHSLWRYPHHLSKLLRLQGQVKGWPVEGGQQCSQLYQSSLEALTSLLPSLHSAFSRSQLGCHPAVLGASFRPIPAALATVLLRGSLAWHPHFPRHVNSARSNVKTCLLAIRVGSGFIFSPSLQGAPHARSSGNSHAWGLLMEHSGK